MYTQCKISYEANRVGVAWIPSNFAKKYKNIIIGKNKSNGIKAKVLEVWGRTDVDMANLKRSWDVGGL